MRNHLLSSAAALVAALCVADFASAQEQPRPRPPAAQGQRPPAGQATPARPPAGRQPAAAPTAAPAPPPAAAVAPSGASSWISRCSSPSRKIAPDCAVEQRAILSGTGQVVTVVSVRLPHDSRQPILVVHVPMGMYLPPGVNIQIDEGKAEHIAFQTCDMQGCYANLVVPAELLTAMKGGTKLAVSFQGGNQEPVTIPMNLADFGEAYKNIEY
jgi:invasion protein IalB